MFQKHFHIEIFKAYFTIFEVNKALFNNLWRSLAKMMHCTKIKFSIKDFFSKCDHIRRKLSPVTENKIHKDTNRWFEDVKKVL